MTTYWNNSYMKLLLTQIDQFAIWKRFDGVHEVIITW